MGRMKWLSLISYRQTWAFVAGKVPDRSNLVVLPFLGSGFSAAQPRGQLIQIGVPIMVIYVIADIGSVAGGWFSSSLISAARVSISLARATMLICASVFVPIVLAYRVESLWGAVLIIGLAAGGHQGFSANLFAVPSDTFPAQAVGSVVGMGGMAGAIGGMLIAKIVGYTLQWTGSYMVPFFIAGSRT